MNRFFRFSRIFRFDRKQDHLGLMVLVQKIDLLVADDERRFEGDRLQAVGRPMLQLLGQVEPETPQMLILAPKDLLKLLMSKNISNLDPTCLIEGKLTLQRG